MTKTERREIGKRCRQLIETRYSLPVVHARYDAIYHDLVHHK